LAERSQAWTTEKRTMNYGDTALMLTGWKRDPDMAWLREVSSVPLQQCLRHLHRAFTSFWAKRTGYPSFKSKHRHQDSASFTGFGFSFREGALKLAKCSEPLNIAWSKPLPEGASPSTVIVSRDPSGRWHISFQVKDAQKLLLPKSGAAVGLDAGLTSLVTFSTGEKVVNPKHELADRKKLVRAQRNLARKHKGSKNKNKARIKVARVHARIADRRRDHMHKLTTRIVRENQTIAIEDLGVSNMIKNHSLARSISGANWGEMRRQLNYKCQWYGRELIVIDRWYPSSKTCSECGHLLASLSLSVKKWTCPGCGAIHDRDVNAARNILAAGLAVSACGAGVRPKRVKPQRQLALKQESLAREG